MTKAGGEKPAAQPSSALAAALEAEEKVQQHLSHKRSFLLEAGAGAGKTYSLVEVLKRLLRDESATLRHNNQQIACITYTNRAAEVISARIDGNNLVAVSTIHAWCWSLLKAFQSALRKDLQSLDAWKKRLADGPPVAMQSVEYELGYRRITETQISLHHDDVLELMAKFLAMPKFRLILTSRFPYVLIDEYQDTNTALMAAIKAHLIEVQQGPLIGLFGDHWQRIYDETCGYVSSAELHEVGKKANFRSATSIVSVLNKMRPELPQAFKDETFVGSAKVFHTNSWKGTRRNGAGGGHWAGDLPVTEAHQYLQGCIAHLTNAGWDFAPDKTKVLLLTHNGLAAEQGYGNLAQAFRYNDLYVSKSDDHIAFFVDKLEPAVAAYRARRFGEMFDMLGEQAPRLTSREQKLQWSQAMDKLVELRESATIGEVVDHLMKTKHPRLPEKVYSHEKEAAEWDDSSGTEVPEVIDRVRKMRVVSYTEMVALAQYLEGHTPFTTKHNVKGDEFENVLVVLGRGWNRYNFDQLLQWMANKGNIPQDRIATYERNRNLFYVTCSRPTTNLALLFTQLLSPASLALITSWFGANQVIDVGNGEFPRP